jgi:hypothetical protein
VRLRPFLVAGVTAAMSLLVMSPVRANENEVTVTFFHSANAEARWAHFTPAPPGDPDTWSIKLRLGTTPGTCPVGDFSCYAGADFPGLAGPPPAQGPSFDFFSTVGAGFGLSGGSPRLVMVFSDSTNTNPSDLSLRPLAWTPNQWTTEDGSTLPDWDNRGGTCGSLYEAAYSVGIACHPGTTVTDVFVVTDSSWLNGPYTHYIDNIRYGSSLITSPEGAGCHEGDGNGHFKGNNGDGNFQSDSDGCRDGDEDHVDSDNRGDGKDFHSTKIESTSLNSLGNTMTITGAGTSAGVPVTFVLVEVESTPLTPGSISMSFSDGFTNAGNLLDGSILLH